MKKNDRIFWTTAIIAVVVLCLAITIVAGIVINNSVKATMAVPLVEDTEKVAEEIEKPEVQKPEEVAEEPKMVGSISDTEEDTYFPELSCSHLESCTVAEVPEGYFTIGFTDNGNGCDWKLFDEGDTIDYEGLDEFHTYNNLLPLTKLEGFVASQFQYVLACTINN